MLLSMVRNRMGSRVGAAGVAALGLGMAACPAAWACQEVGPAAECGGATLTRSQTLERLGVVLDVEFDGQPLHDVVRYIELVADVDLDPLWIDERHRDGLDPMAPVCVDAREIAAIEVLVRAVEQAAEHQRLEMGATWQFGPTGLVELGPRERLNRPEAIRGEVYEVHDLLAEAAPVRPIRARFEPPRSGARRGGSREGSDGAAIGGDLAPPDEGPAAPAEAPARVDRGEELIRLITELVEREQWVRNGGEAAEVVCEDGVLIVLAPDYVHRGLVGPLEGSLLDLRRRVARTKTD